MTQRSRLKELVLFLLLISPLLPVTVQAEVSSLEVTPASPSQGDVVTIRIAAQPEEEVAIIISFSKTLSVVDGKYEWILEDVQVPSTPNRVSVRAESVANVHISTKIIFLPITKSATATDGVVTISQGNVPIGTYDLRLHGYALPNATAVTLNVTASATVKTDSEGIYDYSYNTSNIPLGTFRVEAGSVKKTVNLNEKGSSPPPAHAELAIRDLSVYPPVSSVGSEIRVTAMVINTGERLEDRMIGFSIDREPYTEEQVSLESGESRYLDFSLTGLEEGWHVLTVMDSSRSFVVVPAQTEDTASRVFEQLKGVPSELVADILDSVSPKATSNETARELGLSEAIEVIESAVELGLTRPFSTLLLNMEKDEGATLLISVEPRGGSALLKSMYETDPQSCAALVEAATSLESTVVVEILDLVETDLLSQVLLEIARLPSTPSTVARLLEGMSPERVMAVARSWIDDGHLRELGLVLDEAPEEMLNTVTGNLEKEDQLLMLPHLLPETFAQIDPGLLTLPDLTVIDVSVDRSDAMKYLITVDIRNTGVEPTCVDVTLTVDGSRADTFTVDEIRGEEELTVEFHWEPDAVGGYRIGAVVDGDNDVFEINENDNTGYTDVVVENPRSWTGIYLALGALVLVVAAVAYRKYR
ncbi:hypothetical protein ISS39_00590 [Candidatus Bathyarchaeota archaeon]|nr:hypothetical protein [Candidatus Bathyarchaeota archaeon]